MSFQLVTWGHLIMLLQV